MKPSAPQGGHNMGMSMKPTAQQQNMGIKPAAQPQAAQPQASMHQVHHKPTSNTSFAQHSPLHNKVILYASMQSPLRPR